MDAIRQDILDSSAILKAVGKPVAKRRRNAVKKEARPEVAERQDSRDAQGGHRLYGIVAGHTTPSELRALVERLVLGG